MPASAVEGVASHSFSATMSSATRSIPPKRSEALRPANATYWATVCRVGAADWGTDDGGGDDEEGGSAAVAGGTEVAGDSVDTGGVVEEAVNTGVAPADRLGEGIERR